MFPFTLPDEQWKPIHEAPQYYVSNLGRIASTVKGPPRLKSSVIGPCGYTRVALCPSPGKNVTRYVHRLVAQAFLPPPRLPSHEVDHIDGDQRNNPASNLRWVTRSQNMLLALQRNGNWLAASPKKTSPIIQHLPDGSQILHPSIISAARSLGKPKASANLCHAISNATSAYGSTWSRP